MTTAEIMKELESYGNEQTKKTLMNHGAKEPFFGVKVADLKKILKKTKKNYELSKELYATGNSDAMYLAGLMADETKMTKADIAEWMDGAYWTYLSEWTVPWVTSETAFGFEQGLEWIDEDNELKECAGWQTLSSLAALKPDEELDIQKYGELLDRVGETIHDCKNRVRHVMNAFVIAVGSTITPLHDHAKKIAEKIGKVSVDQGGTACKVPLATQYIQKVVDRGSVGKKRKSARC